ncbi:MAG: hypothetical protein ACOCP4_00635 [Candidatus Woesearchaeota archaeon]
MSPLGHTPITVSSNGIILYVFPYAGGKFSSVVHINDLLLFGNFNQGGELSINSV